MAVAVVHPSFHNDQHNANLLHNLNSTISQSRYNLGIFFDYLPNFRERFETDSFCDATLQVDDKTFNIHKCIVGKISAFFRNLFKVEMKEKYDSFATMKGFTCEIMESILTYVYTGCVEINEENVFDLLSASDYLLVDGLNLCCRDYLMSNITKDNCIKYYLTGKRYHWVVLERKAEEIFRTNFQEILKQNDFATLAKEDVTRILSRLEQGISVFKERNVYEGVIAWVKHDTEVRKNLLSEMLQSVTFKYLPKQYLETVRNECLVQEIRELVCSLDGEIDWKKGQRNGIKNSFAVLHEKEVQLFDYFSMIWTKLPELPNDSIGACVAAHRSHLYVVGGANAKQSIQRLNTYEEGAMWEDAGRTIEARVGSTAAVLGDRIIISGSDPRVKTAEAFIDSGAKIQPVPLSPMQCTRHYHSMVVSNGSIYSFGDFGYNETSEFFSNNSWQVLKPEKRFSSCVAAAGNNKIFVFSEKQDLEEYNVASNLWVKRSECPVKYQKYSASFLENKLFTFGRTLCGDRGSQYLLVEYDIPTDTWTTVYSCACDSDSFIFSV